MSVMRAVDVGPVESSRLAALHSLQALDQPRSYQLDTLARLAAFVCGTPTAVLNLIDQDRQFSAAAYGCKPADVSRRDSMCSTSIQSVDVSYTADAATDARWSDNPFVTGVLDRIRLYAAAPLILSSGEVIGTICAFSGQRQELTRVQLERLRDIADQVVLVLQLRDDVARLGHAATRDHLTGLPNRALFSEALRMALSKHQRGSVSPSVIFLDLDRFKAVNDTHGHAVGDELLHAVAQRLLETVRATDLVARLSGDELVILTEAAERDDSAVAVLINRLRQAFTTPFELTCGAMLVGASLGHATAVPGDSPASLLARADEAMYASKHRSGQPS
ncbi:MAG: sensor domain-containing diguanylate cyclase [Jatrophihabitantaceae bacterium]